MKDPTDHPEPPARLAAALRSLRRDAPLVPADRDEAILRRLRGEFTGRFQPRILPYRKAVLALAACLLLGVFSLWFLVQPKSTGLADLNRDGVVDILDALALARQIEAGQDGVDLNGDGVVDERDVEFLAAEAVRLPGGSS